MPRNDRPRKSRLVPLVDTEALKPLLDQVAVAIYGESFIFEVLPQVLVDVVIDGLRDKAVICTEGVGHDVSGSNTLDIFCLEGGMSYRAFSLPIQVERIPVKGEVDFAEFVRKFGDRLESNWGLWERKMADFDKSELARKKQA